MTAENPHISNADYRPAQPHEQIIYQDSTYLQDVQILLDDATFSFHDLHQRFHASATTTAVDDITRQLGPQLSEPLIECSTMGTHLGMMLLETHPYMGTFTKWDNELAERITHTFEEALRTIGMNSPASLISVIREGSEIIQPYKSLDLTSHLPKGIDNQERGLQQLYEGLLWTLLAGTKEIEIRQRIPIISLPREMK